MPLRARVAVLAVVSVSLLGFGPAANAVPQIGFKAHSFDGFNAEVSGGAITGQKPESKLWFHDGRWWAAMLSPAANGAHTIWRLDAGGWTDTGVVIDTRPSSKEDIISQGNTLYIASRVASGLGGNLLRRFTYASGTYTLNTGFPAKLPGAGEETLTLAKDTTGRLWITFERGGSIFVAHSLNSEIRWSPEFVIPVTGASGADPDDISSIISFTDATGPAVGVMWSNHATDSDYFAVHRDGAAVNVWSVETALTGPKQADDHISLKTFEGRIYAVVKTEVSDLAATLVWLLVRSPSGTWSTHHVARRDEFNTRPITLLNIDPAERKVYVFMTRGEGSDARGIFYKTTSLDGISFPSTATAFIQGANNETINDATSMKQNTDATSGIVILASDGTHYWWNRLGGGPAGAPPSANAGSATVTEDTPTGLVLSGTDPDTCDLIFSIVTPPAHGSLGSIGSQGCTAGNPNTDQAPVTYSPAANYAGPDSFTFIVNDGASSSSPATVSLTVTPVNDPPAAASGSASTSAGTPVIVTLGGSDHETCDLEFAVVTAPANGTLGPLTTQGCTTGAPHTDRVTVQYTPQAGFTGSDSFKFTVNDGTVASAQATMSITVGTGAPGIAFRSVSSASNGTSTSITIPAPATQPGDVMLAAITVRGSPANIIPPTDWTLVRMDQHGFVMRQAIYVKTVGAEPTSYTWSFGQATEPATGGIVAYSGVNTANPVDAHSGALSSTTRPRASIIARSVTTTVNGAMIVGFFGIAHQNPISPPSGMTERFDVVNNSGSFWVDSEGADVIQTTAGPTGDKVATTVSETTSIGQLVALKPAV